MRTKLGQQEVNEMMCKHGQGGDRDDGDNKYAPGHLFLAVKDSNIPGKLCAKVRGGYRDVSCAVTLLLALPHSCWRRPELT